MTLDTEADRRAPLTIIAHDIGLGGGMERALFEVVHTLSQRFDVTIISATLDPTLVGSVQWRRIRVPARPFIAKYLAFALVASLVAWRHRHRTVVSNGALVFNAVDLSWVHFSHLAFAEHNVSTDTSWWRSPTAAMHALTRVVSRGFERWSYRPAKARVLVAVSEDAATDLRRLHPALDVITIPNGIDHEHFGPDDTARIQMRKELELNDGDLGVLFVGGDWQRKGLPATIEAMARLRTRHPQAQLLVAGTGDEAAVNARAAELGVAENIRLLGFRADVADVMRASDVLVSPSQYETFNLAVHEAAASGLAICATPVAGVRSLVVDGVSGTLVEPTAESIAEGLCAMFDDPDLRRRMSAAAHEAVQRFRWESTSEAFADLIAAVDARRADDG